MTAAAIVCGSIGLAATTTAEYFAAAWLARLAFDFLEELMRTTLFAVVAVTLAATAPAAEQLAVIPLTAANWQTPPAIRANLPNVCSIRTRDRDNSGSMGSGTYLGDRLVLTAWHVIRDAAAIGVVFPDDQGMPVAHHCSARVLAADQNWDQALLELQAAPPNLAGVPLATANPRPGDLTVLAGYSTRRLAMRPGRVVGYYGNGSGRSDFYASSGGAVQGDSGGAMFTETGALIGNIWGGSDDGQRFGQVTGRTHAFLARWFPRLAAWRSALNGVAANGGRVLITPIFRQAIVNPPAQTAAAPSLNIETSSQCYGGQCYQPGPGSRSVESPNGAPNLTPPLPAADPPAPQKLELRLGIGKTETLPAGSPARVEIRAEGQNTWLDFYLPRGDPGQVGPMGPMTPIDPAALARDIQPHLDPIHVQTVDADGHARGPRHTVPLGEQLNLHHRLIE